MVIAGWIIFLILVLNMVMVITDNNLPPFTKILAVGTDGLLVYWVLVVIKILKLGGY